MRRFYKGRGFQPAWLGSASGRAKARELVETLARADEEGLEPADYGAAALERRLDRFGRAPEAFGETDRLALERALTRAFLQYAGDLATGHLDPERFGIVHLKPAEPARVAALVAALAPDGSVRSRLEALAPDAPAYAALGNALAEERRREGRGERDLAAGSLPRLRPGERVDARDLALLEDRLRRSGHLDGVARFPGPVAIGGDRGPTSPERSGEVTNGDAPRPPPRYDGAVVAAVERFQADRDLAADGIVGPRTREALARDARDRIARIRVNMERWRWLDTPLARPHVRVNLASQELVLERTGRPALRMPVVVGERDWESPVFSDEIEAVVVNPYWNVPESIARDELLPELLEDPESFDRRHLQFVKGWGDDLEPVDPASVDGEAVERALAEDGALPWRLRQEPFPGNALGRLKFLLPNRHAIYLHDTPAEALFEREDRAFSHGCIRVARPLDLAMALLGEGPGWTEERLRDAIASGERQRIALTRPVPVHLVYWTVEVEEDGVLRIYEDLYGLDARMHEALRDGRSTGRGADAEGAMRPSASAAHPVHGIGFRLSSAPEGRGRKALGGGLRR